MQVSLTASSGLERRLEIAVPSAQVQNAIESRLRDIARNARLKGFRPGKAPLTVVRQQFGPQVHGEVVSDLMQSSFSEAVSREQLRPASGPRIDQLKSDPGQDLSYVAVFEVLPEVKLNPPEQLRVEKPEASIGETDVDAMVETMRQQRPNFTVVERAAAEGDRVTVSFEGALDGVVFEGGSGKDIPFVIGAGRMLTEFESGAKGLKAGESKVVSVTFPADYGKKELAGRTAEFNISLAKVEEQSLPELTDEFVESFGIRAGGVAAFRQEVRNSMQRELDDAIRSSLRQQVLDALYKCHTLELPKVLIEQNVQELQVEAARRLGIRDVSQVPAREPFEEPARRRVALGLILGELMRQEKIQLDRARVNARLNEVVASYPNGEEMRRQYLQSAEAMRQIESQVQEEQILEWVLARAQQTPKPTSFQELTRFGQKVSA